ncbi:hypothetical protein [Lacticaseibacillus porcinae]|uniref:hypothetical protein n=1 Tax=Lacticaseibacillus porcinae TaxID=1123687 RepID=UPI000F77CC6C|nr:hypothetical protein [Lacticaseibacillus porcinae]
MIITLKMAKTFDDALKTVSPRLFVTYLPPYQDLRGKIYPANFEVGCRDPEDPEVSAVLSAGSVLVFNHSNQNGELLLSEKRRKMASDVMTKLWPRLDPKAYVPVLNPVPEAEYQPLMVEKMSHDEVNLIDRQLQDVAKSKVAHQDFVSLIDQAALADNLYDTVMRHADYRGIVEQLPPHPRIFPEVMYLTNNYTDSVALGVLKQPDLDHLFDQYAVAKVVGQQLGNNIKLGGGERFLQTTVAGARLYLVASPQGSFFDDEEERWYKLIVVGSGALAQWLKLPERFAQADQTFTLTDDGGFKVVAKDDR